jgi:hypothetical protein
MALAWATAHLALESSMKQLPALERLPEGLEVVFQMVATCEVHQVPPVLKEQNQQAVNLAHEIIELLLQRDHALDAFENEIRPLEEFLYLFHTLNPTDLRKRHQHFSHGTENHREMMDRVKMWQDMELPNKHFSGLLQLSRRAEQLYDEADRIFGGELSGSVPIDSDGQPLASTFMRRQPFRGRLAALQDGASGYAD